MANTLDQFSYSLMKFLTLQYGEIDNAPFCDSPIEGMLLWALSIAGELHQDNILDIGQQKPIGGYRVDFLVKLSSRPVNNAPSFSSEVIVECDGHDYHERTKEQASRDKERDRFLQQLGYKVFRYTGSDIWKDAMSCAAEVIEFLSVSIEEKSIKHWQETHPELSGK